MVAQLSAIPDFQSNVDAAAALQEMGTLCDALAAMDALERVSFDLSLARGLDYYTGVIYEAVLLAGEGGEAVSVGSVAAGGRCVPPLVLCARRARD